MSTVSIGINSNVKLVAVSHNTEKNYLSTKWEKVKTGGKGGLFGKREAKGEDEASVVNIFGFKMVQDVESENAVEQMRRNWDARLELLKHLFQHTVKPETIDTYFTDQALFKGTSIPCEFDKDGNVKEDFASAANAWLEKALLDSTIVETLNNNIFTIMAKIGATENLTLTPVRLKMRRQSAEKAYPTFPDVDYNGAYSYNNGSAFIELMTIPETHSKLYFSAKERGLEVVKDENGKSMKDADGKTMYKKKERGFDQSYAGAHDSAPSNPKEEEAPASIFSGSDEV